MKQIFYLIVILFFALISEPTFSQWILSNPRTPPIENLPVGEIKYVAFSSDSVGFFLMSANGIKTTDRGNNLLRYDINLPSGINKIISINKNDLLLVCAIAMPYGASERGSIYKSSDNGNSWTLKLNTNYNILFRDASKSPNGNLYVLGYSNYANSEIYKSTDLGETWSKIFRTGTSEPFRLYVLQFIDDLLGFAYGDGTCYLTNDGGQSWNISTLIPRETLNKFYWSDKNNGMILTISNKLKKTTDGGINWSELVFPSKETVSDFIAYNSKVWFVVTASEIFKTTDFGETWISEYLLKPMEQYSPYFKKLYVKNNKIWAVGWPSLICSRDELTSAIATSKQDIPTNFRLSQNYPNPFNSTTLINYEIPVGSFINITVYDLLGRKIKVLINDFKDMGSYSTYFNLYDLATGIYYYTLSANNIHLTRKMIYLK